MYVCVCVPLLLTCLYRCVRAGACVRACVRACECVCSEVSVCVSS